jgi:hypothetical protein
MYSRLGAPDARVFPSSQPSSWLNASDKPSSEYTSDLYAPAATPVALLYSGLAVQIVASSALFLKKMVFCMQCDYQSTHAFTTAPDGTILELSDVQKMELLCDSCLRNSARTVPPSGHALIAARLLSSRTITVSPDGTDAVVCCTSFMDSIVPRYLRQVAETLHSADDRSVALAVARGAVEAELDSLTTSPERCLWSGSSDDLVRHLSHECQFVYIKSPDQFGKYVRRGSVNPSQRPS